MYVLGRYLGEVLRRLKLKCSAQYGTKKFAKISKYIFSFMFSVNKCLQRIESDLYN